MAETGDRLIAATRVFILSGGAAKRAGGINKSLMIIEGRPVIEHQLERLEPMFGPRVTVVTDRSDDFATYGLETISDFDAAPSPEDRFPLRGFARALSEAGAGWAFLLAADMPWPDPDLIRRQAAWLESAGESGGSACRGLVLTQAGRIQPFHAFYAGALAASASAALGAPDRSLRGWIQSEPEIGVVRIEDLIPEAASRSRAFEGFNMPPG